MAFNVGRCVLGDPGSIDSSGDRVSVSGWFIGASLVAAKVVRQQLLAIEVEEVLPVTWSVDSDFDGYYRIDSVDVTAVLGVSYESYGWQYSITMNRIGQGYSNPDIETIVMLGLRTNGVGITSGEADGVTGYRLRDLAAYGEPSGSSSGVVRTGEDGTLMVARNSAPTAASLLSTSRIPPDRYYDNSCLIERLVSGTWYPVQGIQSPGSMAGAWRISNGLIRVTASQTNVGDLKLEVYDGGWVSTTTEWRYGQDSTGTFSVADSEGGFATGYDQANSTVEWVEPYIIRNEIDTVILGFNRSAGYSQTFKLHAADYFVEFSSTVASGHVHAVKARTSTSFTPIGAAAPFAYDPGIQQTSNDANGNKTVVLYTDDGSWVTYGASGGLYQGVAATTATFGFGVVKDGSSAAAGDTAYDLAEQYVAAKSWSSRVVAR